MVSFQQTITLLIGVWLLLVAVRHRRSTVVLMGGLLAVGLCTSIGILSDRVLLSQLGMNLSTPWFPTVAFALVWLGLMYAYSPLADRLATRLVATPPTLGMFGSLQESKTKLMIGIVVAWIFGGFFEELAFRGIVLQGTNGILSTWLAAPVAATIAVCIAGAGAGVIHLYQGPRAAIIIVQLSILFGGLFVLSGYNLWAVILCHGLYDTIAFVRFATKKSKYSQLPGQT